jgi:hypothetical protein
VEVWRAALFAFGQVDDDPLERDVEVSRHEQRAARISGHGMEVELHR